MKAAVLVGLSMTAVCALLTGCPMPAPKCNSDSDCLPSFRCGDAKTCVLRTACTTNKGCSDEAGEPAMCRKTDGVCVKLRTPECTRILGDEDDLENDNTVFFGSMLPTEGPDESSGIPQENSIEVARREIKRTVNGLPPTTMGGQTRPIVYIGCNHDSDAIAAARHLAVDLQVPGIVGAAFSGVTQTIASQVTIPAGTLLMSPSATSQAITSLDDHGLVWRTSPSDTLQAKAIAGLVTQLEARVRQQQGLMAGDRVTLMIANKGDGYGQGLGDELQTSLIFNGESPLASGNSPFFGRTNYGDPDDPNNTNPAMRFSASVSAILAKQPHIVIIVGTNEAVTQVFQKVEEQWDTGVAYRPFYIFTDGGELPELLAAVNPDGGVNNALRQRVFGSVPGVSASDTRYSLFLAHYTGEFNDGSDPTVFGTAGAYDAVYLLAYAAAAAGASPLNGAALNAGLKRLVGGSPKIEVGTLNIGSAFMTLSSSSESKINVEGASGPLDFNVDTGEAPSDVQTWCIAASPVRFFFTGYFYNATSGMMQGTLTCP